MSQNSSTARALLDQMGGPVGLVYSALPVVVFVPVSTIAGLQPAIFSALGVATLILLWRLWRRESTQPAISGFFGVGICSLVAYIVGESKGYFLLGIWSSLAWAGVFALSVLIRRPIVGYIWGWFQGHDTTWRRVRKAVWAYDVATLIWVAVFLSRFFVQRYLYDIDSTGWLGVARIVMGFPLTILAALSMYFPVRYAQREVKRYEELHAPAAKEPEPAEPAEAAEG